MDGILMDSEYNIIENLEEDKLKQILLDYDSVILKPTVNTDSGHGIILFVRHGNKFISVKDSDLTLSVDNIKGFGSNWIIQHTLQQHPFMAQFNTTSVNTIRIATYTSPYTGKVSVLSAIIRMGAKGAYVDNMHSNGKMIGVDVNTGKITKFCMDVNGERYSDYNGVDFSRNEMFVPFWNKILQFTTDAACKLWPMKLIQFDVALDISGKPVLIEYNIGGFPMWVAQYIGFPAFGIHTDEIKNYAMSMKKTVKIDILRTESKN